MQPCAANRGEISATSRRRFRRPTHCYRSTNVGARRHGLHSAFFLRRKSQLPDRVSTRSVRCGNLAQRSSPGRRAGSKRDAAVAVRGASARAGSYLL